MLPASSLVFSSFLFRHLFKLWFIERWWWWIFSSNKFLSYIHRSPLEIGNLFLLFYHQKPHDAGYNLTDILLELFLFLQWNLILQDLCLLSFTRIFCQRDTLFVLCTTYWFIFTMIWEAAEFITWSTVKLFLICRIEIIFLSLFLAFMIMSANMIFARNIARGNLVKQSKLLQIAWLRTGCSYIRHEMLWTIVVLCE